MHTRLKLLIMMLLCFIALNSTAIAQSKRNTLGATSQIENIKMLVAQAQQYEHGEGIQQDREKAAELYCQAAQRGSAEGQYALGWMHANGRGIERDDIIAAHLFKMAAAQDHPHAKKMLELIPPSSSSKSYRLNCSSTYTSAYASKSMGKYGINQPVFSLVHKLAPQYQIDPDFVLAVISVESGFNTQAVSSKNAQGLMQLIPATAERFQVKNVFDPEENIKGGMAYLRWLLAFFKGNVALVAAAYNAGEGAVEKYKGIPPYPETINYVEKITARYQKSIHPYQPDVVSRTSFMFTAADN
jgi:soluble lytic murein transglycosylase-like protein